jgi:hypothetical protein
LGPLLIWFSEYGPIVQEFCYRFSRHPAPRRVGSRGRSDVLRDKRTRHHIKLTVIGLASDGHENKDVASRTMDGGLPDLKMCSSLSVSLDLNGECSRTELIGHKEISTCCAP